MDGYYKDKQLELNREIHIFGDITKKHIAEVHEKMAYLQKQIIMGAIEEHQAELMARLKLITENKPAISTFKKVVQCDLSDWQILNKLNDSEMTPEIKQLNDDIARLESFMAPDMKIKIWLNSGGGTITDGLALIDMINSCEFDVEIVATGDIMSMAIPILASGSPGCRYATENTMFMMHASNCGAVGGVSDLVSTTKYLKLLDKKVKKIICKRTKLKSKEYDKYESSTPYYFDAKRALEIGLIDEIL